MRPQSKEGRNIGLLVAVLVIIAAPVSAEEKKDIAPPVICPGCISPIFPEEGKGQIIPYGRIELDVIYSTRNTNPLDPGQFNGYATSAGKSNNASSTFNPRYSVFGVRGERTDGKHSLTGVVEVDFYSQTDNAGNISPRLRLVNVRYGVDKTSITVGMDWSPIMGLLTNGIDFAIMGYNGNLWQRLPQITVRHKFNDNFEGLFTVLRFERGLSAIQPQTQRRPFTGAGAGTGGTAGNCGTSGFGCSENAFNDPVQHPYYGVRMAYNGTGNLEGLMFALNGAYRYYRSAPTALVGGIPSGRDINSYIVGGELVVPITKQLKFAGELGYGQALDVEWFRYGQGRNLGTGAPIRTLVGWAELNYAYSKNYTFVAGYGFDNPLNSDLRGTTAAVDQQYLLNHRTYLTVVRRVWADFYTGWEWNHLMTEWSTTEKFHGDNYMMSFWYNF
jgi:hypothetical protein